VRFRDDLTSAVMVIFLASCGQSVLIQDGAGLVLSYRCHGIESRAESSEAVELVRRSAGRAVRYERDRDGLQRVSALDAAFRAGDDAALEVALVESACAQGDAAIRLARFPEPGSEPPGFSLADLDRDETLIALDDQLGRIVLVNFWATWCGPCRYEYPELVEIAREFADSGVVVLGILKDDSPEAARRWVADHGGGIPTLVDPDGSVARSFRVRALPQTFVIGRDGRVVGSSLGYRAEAAAELVRSALRGGS
jgi:cytochrome c biogenesis protein CcmG, thiol:disulfide interchange protein DsbE